MREQQLLGEDGFLQLSFTLDDNSNVLVIVWYISSKVLRVFCLLCRRRKLLLTRLKRSSAARDGAYSRQNSQQ